MRKTDDHRDRKLRSLTRRADRVVCEDDRWYVLTREGRRGPFSTRRAADAEARLFVDTMQYLERTPLPGGLDHGDITVVDMNVMPWG